LGQISHKKQKVDLFSLTIEPAIPIKEALGGTEEDIIEDFMGKAQQEDFMFVGNISNSFTTAI
jgi:hypothetical protein